MSTNNEDLNLFYPIGELSPQGWLNDFILPQVMKNKEGAPYCLFYRNYDFLSPDTKRVIDPIFNGVLPAPNLETYKSINKSKFSLDEKFIYLNGRYADKLENFSITRSVNKKSKGVPPKDYIKFLNSVKPYQLAFFQPYMRMYYGFKKEEKEADWTFIEFPFSQKFDLDSILQNPNAFLEGSGIKSVTNNSQLTIGTGVNSQINVSFFFSNMNVLTRELETNLSPPYGFSFQKIFANFISSKNEILKLEYGYRVDPALGKEHNIPENICDMINNREQHSFLLNKVSHNFKFNKEGSLEISVTYYNMFDSKLKAPNVISIPTMKDPIINMVEAKSAGAIQLITEYYELKNKEKTLQEKLQKLREVKVEKPKEVGKNTDVEIQKAKDRQSFAVERFKKDLKENSASLNNIKRQLTPFFKDIFLEKIQHNLDLYSITTKTKKTKEADKVTYSFNSDLNLIFRDGREGKICSLSQKQYDLDSFLRNPGATKEERIKRQSVESKLESLLNRIFDTPVGAKSDKKTSRILFFPLKALIRAAYEMLDVEERVEIPHILFGNLSSRISLGGKEKERIFYVNSGHILIEVTTFQKWLHQNFYSKSYIDFSFGEFLEKIINDLIPEALYRNKPYPQDKSRLTIQDYYVNFSISKNWNKSTPGKPKLKDSLEVLVGDEDMKNFSSEINYAETSLSPLIIWSKLDLPTVKEATSSSLFFVNSNGDLNLNEEQDAGNGIPHIVIGADGGMFTNVDFTQIDLKNFRTGVALQSLTDLNSNNFFYHHSINAEVIGSSIFKEGSIICIPTAPFGLVNAEYDMGIIGYYKVKDISHNISPSGFKATVSGDFFWNPVAGKRGKMPDSNQPTKKTAREIFDFVDASYLDPIEYINNLIRTDISTLVNFGVQEKGKKVEKNEEKKVNKSKKPATTKNEGKELDV